MQLWNKVQKEELGEELWSDPILMQVSPEDALLDPFCQAYKL